MKRIWDEEQIKTTAARVVEARRLGLARDTFPGQVPSDLLVAYRVQAEAIRQSGEELIGFKVGGIPERFQDAFPAPWLVGPALGKNLFRVSEDGSVDVPVFEGGFAAYEPELIFTVRGNAYKDSVDWSYMNSREVIDRIFLGAEIAASPNINVNALGPGSIISDFGNNSGVVLGRELPLSDLGKGLTIMVETRIDNEFIGKCIPNQGAHGPLGALAFLLNHLRDNPDMYDLPDVLYVSSGAITGVHQSRVGTSCEMIYEDFEILKVSLVA